MADGAPVLQAVLDKEAEDDRLLESIDDRQLMLWDWSPFGSDGYPRPTLVKEGWHILGALTEP